MDIIVWKFNVYPGHEFCRLFQQDSNWSLEGTAAFLYEQKACCLGYRVNCNPAWQTLSACVNGWLGHAKVEINIRTDATQRWWMNEIEVPEVMGCTDIDINFSPCTNTIPIKRTELAIGEVVDVQAAWLKFPSFSLEPLEQRYQRMGEETFRYESGGGKFSADLRVSPSGLVIDYADIWKAEIPAG